MIECADGGERVIPARLDGPGVADRVRQPLANMTRSGYHVTMRDTVGIAELKSRLSEYLRRVRRGARITVLDRETPVARLEPVAPGPTSLTVRRPGPDAPKPRDVRFPPPLKLRTDVLRLLEDEREEQ